MQASLKQGFIFDVRVIGVVEVVEVVGVVDDGKPAFQVILKQVIVFDVGVLDHGRPAILQVSLKQRFIFDVGVIGVLDVLDDEKPAFQVGLRRVVVFDVRLLDRSKPAIMWASLKRGLWLPLKTY